MAMTGTSISVSDEVGVLRDVLVQGPVCRPLGGTAWPVRSKAHQAEQQHGRLVRHLEAQGVIVRHYDALLYSALGFADARDWILERRIGECEDDRRRASEIMSWLSEQPTEVLTRYLMEGMETSALPSGFDRPAHGAWNPGGWFLSPLDDLPHTRGQLRFLDAGAIISQPEPAASRAAAINISAVLNFAPLFDEARFEYWPTADGADRSFPPINGNDIAMLQGMVCVGAITSETSARALSLLAASLFQRKKADTMFWLDLTGANCRCLDDCFLPLSRDCLLVDMKILNLATTFMVRASRQDPMVGVEPCKSTFIEELSKAVGASEFCVIDVNRHSGATAKALGDIAPIVLAPGRIMAFEEHQAAFQLLEQNGIEVVSVLSGSALSRTGKGPRRLVTALRAD